MGLPATLGCVKGGVRESRSPAGRKYVLHMNGRVCEAKHVRVVTNEFVADGRSLQ